VTQAGTYYLTVTDSDCETTVPVEVVFENSTPPTLTVSGTMCPGDVQTIGVEGNFSTYAWTGGATTSTLNVTTPGTYTVTVNAGTCPAVASIDVSYTAVPSIQTTVSGPTCTGATQTITVVNNVYDSYQWENGPATASYDVTTAGEYHVEVMYAGCAQTENINITFEEMAAPVITVVGNPCQDQTLQLTVPNDYSGYSWSNGPTGNNSLVTTSGTYTVTVSDGPCQATATVDVNFGSLMVEPLTVTGTGCPGSLFTLAGANGYDSYSWSPGGNTTSFLNTTTPGEYTLTVTEGPCEGTATANVEYLVLPTLTIAETGDWCPDGLVTLDAGPTYDSYVWTPGNATTSFLNVTQSGVYSVEVMYEGCSLTESTTITFIELPTPTIGQTQNLLTCNEGGYSYQWYLEGTAIAGAINQFLNASTTGNYTVEISSDDCSASSANYYFQYIGVTNPVEAALLLYPNPAMDVLNIQGYSADYVHYDILDITGRIVHQGRPGAVIPLDALSNGVYTIRFVSTAEQLTRRFEKVR